VRGELDWIIMKALEKDRNRRYETANGFAQDVQRYLADEPVQACPPSAGYRLRKFARRNKASLAVAGLVLSFLVVLGSGAGWAVRDRAAREEQVARDRLAREEEIAREQAAREREIARDRAAQQALVEQAAARALALSDDYLREGNWRQSLAEARRAETVLASATGADAPRNRVAERLADLAILLRLEDLARLEVSWPAKARDKAYAQAFREYGIDLDALDADEAARQIGARAIRTELAFALDGWALRGRGESKADAAPRRQKLLTIARAVDSDDWRNRLREMIEKGNTGGLVQLAQRPEATEQPPPTLDMLARSLMNAGQANAAADVLLRAYPRHRGDFRINSTLGLVLRTTNPPRLDDSLRFRQATVALRPDSPGLLSNLALALAEKGRHDEAIDLFRESIRRGPTWVGARIELGMALHKRGKLDEAADAFREAIKVQSENVRRNRQDLNVEEWQLHLRARRCAVGPGSGGRGDRRLPAGRPLQA
jgi:tetratricopeptide (TPR) repeat protein